MTKVASDFPILEISKLAEKESWRKEINRPIYHLHKWWAQRLGSVFRAILIYLMKSSDEDTWRSFYAENHFDKVILDPFMGSGTTLGEALKLGSRVVGCDINPISSFLVKQELTSVPIKALNEQMSKLENSVAPEIRKYYTTIDPDTKERIPVLYYFWVKVAVTPDGEEIPLFSDYVFSKNAYASKKPMAQIICPKCWGVLQERYDTTSAVCTHCGKEFNPQIGAVKGAFVTDSHEQKYKIKSLLPENGRFEERLFALLAITNDGTKKYLPVSAYDLALYRETIDRLSVEDLPLPTMAVRRSYNTDQARGYNYLTWRSFFNSRQQLCLGLLLKEILKINDDTIREQFLCLFSSTLEFNNMFCSYKGEGTGAVRPIFSNHILKPERTPLENSVWGSEKSSGCFSTLYRTRFLSAKTYLDNPFEIQIDENGQCKKVAPNTKLRPAIVSDWTALSNTSEGALVLCGDSANVPLPDNSVDMVVTDPPYFDYIHYSELSDFFFAWLSPVLKKRYPYFEGETSGRENEVQHTSPDKFAKLLSRVFCECNRVMKDNAKLCFSFHHARPEGWTAIVEALVNSDFYVVEAFPVHAELMASTPKAGTKEPISLDTILVCSKNEQPLHRIEDMATRYFTIFNGMGKKLSRSDVFVIFAAQTLVNCVNSKRTTSDTLNQMNHALQLSADYCDDTLRVHASIKGHWNHSRSFDSNELIPIAQNG
jgi:putative DNA methylase